MDQGAKVISLLNRKLEKTHSNIRALKKVVRKSLLEKRAELLEDELDNIYDQLEEEEEEN